MNADLVKFDLPADFITSRASLTIGELAYGHLNAWISNAAAVKIAEVQFAAGSTGPEFEELALLLAGQLDEVDDVLSTAAVSADGDHDPAGVWLYLALDWLYEHRDDDDDPLGTVEMVYADFNYPPEIEAFVRFMPAPGNVPQTMTQLMQQWAQYLGHAGARFGRSRYRRALDR